MFSYMNILKEKNYIPDTIIDIGAHHGNWTNEVLQIFPESKYFLFEAINYEELNRYNFFPNVKTYREVLLSDKIEEVNWYQQKNTGDSMFREKTHHFSNTEVIKRVSVDLDTFSFANNIFDYEPNNIFIKIDCQGAELKILNGAKRILERTSVILLEVPIFGEYNEGAPTFSEYINFMDEIGFIILDITDKHFYQGFTYQADVFFIKKTHVFNSLIKDVLYNIQS